MGKCRVASANGTSSSQHRTMSKPKQTVKLIVRSKGEPTKTRRAHSESSQKFFSNHRVAPVVDRVVSSQLHGCLDCTGHNQSAFFLWPAPLSFDWSPLLRLTCGPAGNRTTTGSLSASSRTTPYQLLHRDA